MRKYSQIQAGDFSHRPALRLIASQNGKTGLLSRAQIRPPVLPLPKGEGWGEGEQRVQQPKPNYVTIPVLRRSLCRAPVSSSTGRKQLLHSFSSVRLGDLLFNPQAFTLAHAISRRIRPYPTKNFWKTSVPSAPSCSNPPTLAPSIRPNPSAIPGPGIKSDPADAVCYKCVDA